MFLKNDTEFILLQQQYQTLIAENGRLKARVRKLEAELAAASAEPPEITL